MKTKNILPATAALLVLGALWLVNSARNGPVDAEAGDPLHATHGDSHDLGEDGQAVRRQARPALLPPDPNRLFEEMTPEQRVRRARNPNGVGG
jgi:hypothetical protein